MTKKLKLVQHLDTAGAPSLAEELSMLKGQALQIDASDVSFVGTLAAQVLVSASAQWSEDGIAFEVAPISEGFSKSMAGLGIDPTAYGRPAVAPETEKAA